MTFVKHLGETREHRCPEVGRYPVEWGEHVLHFCQEHAAVARRISRTRRQQQALLLWAGVVDYSPTRG
jgi:hypothetical protein